MFYSRSSNTTITTNPFIRMPTVYNNTNITTNMTVKNENIFNTELKVHWIPGQYPIILLYRLFKVSNHINCFLIPIIIQMQYWLRPHDGSSFLYIDSMSWFYGVMVSTLNPAIWVRISVEPCFTLFLCLLPPSGQMFVTLFKFNQSGFKSSALKLLAIYCY